LCECSQSVAIDVAPNVVLLGGLLQKSGASWQRKSRPSPTTKSASSWPPAVTSVRASMKRASTPCSWHYPSRGKARWCSIRAAFIACIRARTRSASVSSITWTATCRMFEKRLKTLLCLSPPHTAPNGSRLPVLDTTPVKANSGRSHTVECAQWRISSHGGPDDWLGASHKGARVNRKRRCPRNRSACCKLVNRTEKADSGEI
jgi:hypothetical protein